MCTRILLVEKQHRLEEWDISVWKTVRFVDGVNLFSAFHFGFRRD